MTAVARDLDNILVDSIFAMVAAIPGFRLGRTGAHIVSALSIISHKNTSLA